MASYRVPSWPSDGRVEAQRPKIENALRRLGGHLKEHLNNPVRVVSAGLFSECVELG